MKFLKETPVLYISMFLMAGCGIGYEYTFSKISSDLLGNSAKQWAIIIGLIMFFMGIGSDIQKYIKDKDLFDKFILFEIILGLIGGFGSILMLYTFSSSRDHFMLVQYLLIIFVGLFTGLEIPLLTRINQSYINELKVNLGGVLKMDYIGSFVGSIVWIFVLPLFFSLPEMTFVLGAINTVVAGLTIIYFKKYINHMKKLMLLCIAALILLSTGYMKSKEWTLFAEQKLFMDKMVFSATTKYQHIVMTKTRSNDIYCYINGNLQFSSIDEHIYHEMLVHPIMQAAESRRNVLILGGGDGLALREILKYEDVKSVTLVDIDPEMTKLAKSNEFLSELNNNSLDNSKVKFLKNNSLEPSGKQDVVFKNQKMAEVNIINLDAFSFIEQISGLYDVIIIDFPDPNNLELSKLYSKGFYKRVKSKLSKYGLFIQQSTSPIHAKETFLCIGRTIDSAGLSAVPMHENVPSFGEWGWWIGAKDEVYSSEKLKSKIESIAVINKDVEYITPQIVKSGLVFGKNMLKTDETSINTITTDAVFSFYEKAWQASQ